MSFPIHMVARPGSPNSYVATKGGRVYLYDGTSIAQTPVLDISGRVSGGSEQGLLALALHPTNASRMFAHYTATNGDTVIAEYTMSNPSSVSAASERIIFRHPQPAGNHNGGMIQFGPGGQLFVSLGDGGGSNDQYGHGQDPDTLLGAITTLRVDGDPDPTIYAIGLRNPWRTWIDGNTFYIADVGQNRFEEINVVPLQAGLNFGWPIQEGDACHQPPSGCDTTGLVQPVVVIAHQDQGTCSVTGGVVYRGSIAEIAGHYFYSDWCGGYLRSFRWTGSVSSSSNWTSQVGRPGSVASFGLDGAGEMYVLTSTAIYKLVRG
jgi:glucose/arabinose dehydrogenase